MVVGVFDGLYAYQTPEFPNRTFWLTLDQLKDVLDGKLFIRREYKPLIRKK